ncbi:MAG: CvpA family protein [Parafilimonas sp.]
MLIDLAFIILVLLAVIKGYSRGLIIAIVSFLAIIIGLAAAMKLSIVVAGWLNNSTNINKQWLPLISFAVVMIAVIILVRWLAGLLQKTVEIAMLGWVNRLGGIVLYVLLYITFFSVVLFYANQMQVIKEETIASSKTYPFIEPWASKAMDMLSAVLPFFKNMFQELTGFFNSIAKKAA